MVGIQGKNRVIVRSLLCLLMLLTVFGSMVFAQGKRYKSSSAWSFGVHGDTQWTVDGNLADNPNYVSAALAKAIGQKLADNGVKFVIQVGDLTDRAGAAALKTRADVAAESYFSKGIGFFPLRGNHETYGYLYGNDPNYDLNVPDFKTNFPQTQGQGSNLFGATNFSAPIVNDTTGNPILDGAGNPVLKGLSYAFDYGTSGNNARFVIVDTEQTAVKHQGAPNNPASCVAAITGYGAAPAGSSCGQGYFYILSGLGNYDTGFTIFQAQQNLKGYTTDYNPDGSTGSAHATTITAGTWFRIDSSKRPSTNFYGWDIPNPTQTYNGAPFDINDPPTLAANRTLEKNSSANSEYFPGKQQAWISDRLNKATRGTTHAFVFSHRPVLNENHTDSLFGADSIGTPADQNAFYASLYNNDAKFMISGHDHLYNRAIDKSPDGLSKVMQIISQGISTKFYTPTQLDSFGKDGTAPNQTWAKLRETQLAQEILNFGYYVYSIDGPRVTVDYYSDAVGNFKDGDYYPNGNPDATPPVPGTLKVPNFNFVKKDTWGYSFNGKEFLVPQGGSYVGQDSFGTTTAKILVGTNADTAKDLTPSATNDNGTPNDPSDDYVSGPRPFYKQLNTGWTAKPATIANMKSDILSLWGMHNANTERTDTYVLSISFDGITSDQYLKGGGRIAIATVDATNKWVNAVNLNYGGTKTFVRGPYASNYTLGTYGVDFATKTAWAVLNYNADFAVVNDNADSNVVSIPFDITKDMYLQGGGIAVNALDVNNNWVNATNLNFTGTKNFILGPYVKYYPVGTYGIDYANKTAWAVLDYNVTDFSTTYMVKDNSAAENVVRKYWRVK
jgi:hypothetical protein